MARAEQRARIVVEVAFDEEDPCPVKAGRGQGLILATWLAGAEVEITDVGPALETGERERGPFLERLEVSIGARVAAIGDRFERSGREPKRGTNERDSHFELVGILHGLTDAYRLLTGQPAATAETRGKVAYEAAAPRRAAREAELMRPFLEEQAADPGWVRP